VNHSIDAKFSNSLVRPVQILLRQGKKAEALEKVRSLTDDPAFRLSLVKD